jgi:hypothetical protein
VKRSGAVVASGRVLACGRAGGVARSERGGGSGGRGAIGVGARRVLLVREPVGARWEMGDRRRPARRRRVFARGRSEAWRAPPPSFPAEKHPPLQTPAAHNQWCRAPQPQSDSSCIAALAHPARKRDSIASGGRGAAPARAEPEVSGEASARGVNQREKRPALQRQPLTRRQSAAPRRGGRCPGRRTGGGSGSLTLVVGAGPAASRRSRGARRLWSSIGPSRRCRSHQP